jgi:hypothetical protein
MTESKPIAKDSNPGDSLDGFVGPSAWLHVMDNTDGIKGNDPLRELTFTPENPFGEPGVDYSREYPVTSTPLYTLPNALITESSPKKGSQ